MKAVQHLLSLEVKMIVTVDEDETNIDDVIADMDYDFNVHPETDHAEIVRTEIMGYELKDKMEDAFLV